MVTQKSRSNNFNCHFRAFLFFACIATGANKEMFHELQNSHFKMPAWFLSCRDSPLQHMTVEISWVLLIFNYPSANLSTALPNASQSLLPHSLRTNISLDIRGQITTNIYKIKCATSIYTQCYTNTETSYIRLFQP